MARSRSSSNTTRGTPGMILLLFAAMLLVASLVQIVEARHEPEPDVAQPFTGLGDTHYYTSLSENDYYNAALVFDESPKGLFRRTVNPVARSDSRMIRCCLESTGQFIVYSEWHSPTHTKKPASPTRWYLKTAPGRYVEFGERKHWPAYQGIPGLTPPAPAPQPARPAAPTTKKPGSKGSKQR